MKNTFKQICCIAILALISPRSAYSQIITTVVDTTGIAGWTGDGGQAATAEINQAGYVTLDALGNLYISDNGNNIIRKVTTSGIITTIAGVGTAGFFGEGMAATSALISAPAEIYVDNATGSIYFADYNNNRVRKISSAGIISTVAGNGTSSYSDGVQATATGLNNPNGIVFDNAGNLYIAEYNGERIRKVNTSGVISTFAGTGIAGFTADGIPATASEINHPFSLAIDIYNNIYISENAGNRIRKVNTSGIISTVVGTGAIGFFGDGGPATAAQLHFPGGIRIDGAGNLFIADGTNYRFREVDGSTGIIRTIAGTGTSGYSGDHIPATAAEVSIMNDVAIDAYGNAYLADLGNNRIRFVNNGDHPPVFSGGTRQNLSVCENSATNTINTLLTINDVDVSQTETWNTYVAPMHGTVAAYYTTSSTGINITPTGLSYTPALGYIGADSFRVWVNDGFASDSTVIVVNVIAASAGAITPEPVTVCMGSTVALGDPVPGGAWTSANPSVATVGSTGIVTGVSGGNAVIIYSIATTCGTANAKAIVTVGSEIINTFVNTTGVASWSGDGGAAATATISEPNDLLVDASGNIFICDAGNNRVRMVNTSGNIVEIAGTGTAGFSGDGAPAIAAQLSSPSGLTMDAAGNLYVSDAANNVVRKITPAIGGTITTIAGTHGTPGYSGDGGLATTATFGSPYGLTLDSHGNLYIVDQSNNVVRMINTSGIISTFAGTVIGFVDNVPATAAKLDHPAYVCSDGSDNIYISDNGNMRIRKVNTAGVISTFAGTGGSGFSGDGFAATSAQLYYPAGLKIDAAGNLIFCDATNNRVRLINTSGIINTIAGSFSAGYGGDGGPATAATLFEPLAVAVDASNNVFIADNLNNRIRKVAPASTAIQAPSTTICQGVSVLFTDAVSGGAWSTSNGGVATVSTTGVVTGVAAGTATISYFTAGSCGVGSAIQPVTVNSFTAGAISGPAIVCAGNNIILADGITGGTWSSSNPAVGTVAGGIVTGIAIGNTTISYTVTNSCGAIAARQQVVVGIPQITTFAGTGVAGATGDAGPATAATLNNPHSLFVDASGNTFISDDFNHKIRMVSSAGIITTIAGTGAAGFSGDGFPATAATLQNPFSVVGDAAGNIYFSDNLNARIRKINRATGIITTVVGTGTVGFFGDGLQATAAQLNSPCGISFDAAGNLYIGDASNQRVRKVATSGIISTIAGVGSAGFFGDGGAATAAYFNQPNYIHADAAGNLYVTDNGNQRIRKITPLGIISTVAGNGGIGSAGDGGQATAAQLAYPGGVNFDGAGNMYIAGDADEKVRVVNAAGFISTYVGTGVASYTGDGGAPATATLHTPVDVAFDNSGNLLIADQQNNVVRKVAPISASVAAIAGPSVVCQGLTINLTETTSGGSWTCSNASVATVGSGSGVVTGITPGVATITYPVTYTCGTLSASQSVTVNALPAVPGAITGPTSFCLGSAPTLNDATPGGSWTSTVPTVATIGSGSGTLTGVVAGSTTISYTIANSCGSNSVFRNDTVVTTPGPITGLTALCVGSTSLLSNTAGSGAWSSSNGSVATIGSSTGLVTAIGPGTATITYSVGGLCNTSIIVTVNANPAGITPPGPVSFCVGASASLSDATSGGVWSSGSGGVATVGTSGTVTGVGSGAANISYTNAAGCSAVKQVTVLVTPSPLAPSSFTICTGNTFTLGETVGGGIWSSTSASVASVAAGIVTGVGVGTAIINYTIGSCFSTAAVTVNLSPNAGTISGPSILCTGVPITYTDAASGGIWSSSNTAIATVSSSGSVTGVTAGTVTISYSVTNTCGTANAVKVITVSASPGAGTIIGTTLICAGTFTTLVDTTAGGTWSSSNGHAGISSSGILTGVIPGLDTISYSITNSCGTASTRQFITVGLFLTADSITGPDSLCAGATISLTDTAFGGVWSSSNSSVRISTRGVVTALRAGIDTIKYTVTSGCGSAVAMHTITVNPVPVAGSITGPVILCAGLPGVFTDTARGGVWSCTNTLAAIDGSGSLSALLPGNDTVRYTVANSCGTSFASAYLTIGTAITAGVISGSGTVCVGSDITLADGATGGVWTASNASAIVSGGRVTGVVVGVDTILYSVTSSCGSASASAVVTVNPLPDAGIISGPASLCLGSVFTYTDVAPAGAWTLSNGFATVTTGGLVTPVSAGLDTLSYTVANSCGTASAIEIINVVVLPVAGIITGPENICAGTSVTLTDHTVGGTWSASNSAASVSGGIVTGLHAGIDTISYTVSSSCGSAIATAAIEVDITPSPGTITGPASVCPGALIPLTDTTLGGAWSASNTNATITISGLVTGIIPGTDTISYTVTNACGSVATTHIITIGTATPVAGSITGPAVVCAGSSITLADAVTGGVWRSSNGTATVSAGVVTGVTSGADTISYTVSSGCGSASATATAIITVGAALTVGAISGPSGVCTGSTITLTDPVSGGSWSSSNPHASVSAGIVTALSAGTDTISYTVTGSCGTSAATKVITIGIGPVAGSITGPASVCAGGAITLTSSASGGTWIASNAHASISSGGAVSAVTTGMDTIYYSVTNACGTAVATHIISITGAPAAGGITGASSLCPGASATLTDGVAGGGWSSSSGSVATVSGTGAVTAVAPGTATISYTVSNTCGHTSATHTITVLPESDCTALMVKTQGIAGAESLLVSPNPNRGTFTMNLVSGLDEEVHVVITNVLGEKVKEFTTMSNRIVELQLGNAAGIYLLNAATANGRHVAKVIIN